MSTAFGPDDVRSLRGPLSRPEFARLVGVTPLTVYRWELPDDASEARRPRGRVLARLQAYATARPAAPPPSRGRSAPDAADAEELAALAPLTDRAATADWRSAEHDLVSLLASGRLRSAGARAIAGATLVRLALLARADVRGAFATLAPLLADADAGRLARNAEAIVHATAALVFSQADGRVFDLGKVNSHCARAEALVGADGPPDVLFLVRASQVSAAFNFGESALVRRQLAQLSPLLTTVTEPVYQAIVTELRALTALFEGNPALSARLHEEGAAQARAVHLTWLELRALALRAMRHLDDAMDPAAALDLLRRAEEVQRVARVQPGLHTLLLARTRAEANLRLGRFDVAEAALREADEVVAEMAWSPLHVMSLWGRLFLHTGRVADLRAYAARMASWDGRVQRDLVHLSARMLDGCADWVSGQGGADKLIAVLDRLEARGGWPFLEREALLYAVAALVVAERFDEAVTMRRRLERFLDWFPSGWFAAGLRRYEGVLLCKQGRGLEGRQLVEGSVAAYTAAGDLPEAALSRRILALTKLIARQPDAEAQLAASEAEVRALGMQLPERLTAESIRARVARKAAASTACSSPVAHQFAVPIERLALRGVGPGLLHRELVSVVADAFPGRGVHLESIDPSGATSSLASTGPDGVAEEWTEFGDGAGGRLRIGVTGALADEDRAVVRMLSKVAALSLEVAVLRGYSSAPSASPAPEDVAPTIPGFVAASPSMRGLQTELGRLASSRSTVIVTGESGVGKEVVARALHHLSVRRDRSFVAFNCAAVPRELFEGQLFGYKKGAFTGAVADHPGVIRAADGGTLFLDEIGELPLDVQPKLLRFLENGEVFPLGERRPVQVDVRVVAATHRDLAQLVRDGRFREDLYYRLQVVPIGIPPLRERPEDVVVLARSFVRQFTPAGTPSPTLSAAAVALLRGHPWRGNVRELRNVVERAMAYAPLPAVLGPEHLRLGS